MSPSKTAFSLSSWLWRSLTSIRLTVILLLILALVATVGTIIPQGETQARYVAGFGPRLGYAIWRYGWGRIFYSPWFLLPVALLALNLLCCVWRGLPQALRRSLRTFGWEAAQALPQRGRFTVASGLDPDKLVLKAMGQELGRPTRVELPDRKVYLYESGRFRPLGPYLIHLSLLLILVGGLVGKFWGVEGLLTLAEGGTATSFELDQNAPPMPLGFELRLKRFQVSFYEGGMPEEFRSDLVFFSQGKEALSGSCRVNDPISFGGLTFYQSSYGTEPDGPAKLKVCQGDDCQTVEAAWRQGLTLPGGRGQLMVVRLDGNFQGLGPAVQVAMKTDRGHPQIFWVSQNHPELAKEQDSAFWQHSGYQVSVESLPFRFYSVFQVRRDPGVWWVYSGFILCLPGFILAFLRPVQRWAVVLTPRAKGGFDGRVLGASPRAREAFAQRLERLLTRLNKGARA